MNKQRFEEAVDALWRQQILSNPGHLKARIDALVELTEKARAPVADAAQFLCLAHGFTANWLKAKSAEEIQIHAKANGESAHKMGFAGLGLGLDAVQMVGLGWLVNPWRFAIMVPVEYPHREETAGAALYLYMNFATNETWLRRSEARTIRVDAQDCRQAMEARKVTVKVTVKSLGNEASGDYIHLKFFRDQRLVGETMINGKTSSPYERFVTLSADFDCYRQECSNTAIFTVERVAK
ncbi:hypothetical protein [uncultured Sphingomonas sp.]|uniref:hypothetical protein n=1 Tax=uncultured Sphingomonas sp. TaxID=158754 RepID=UPI002591BCBB|nr:hypothetical protein [uncultured Sphingomonas sp.]